MSLEKKNNNQSFSQINTKIHSSKKPEEKKQ